MKAPDQPVYAHPAWLILILSLAVMVGGIVFSILLGVMGMSELAV